MSITATSAQKILSLLNQKVRDGALDAVTAKHLAVVALQEVAPAEDQAAAEDLPVDEPVIEEPVADPAPAPSGVDPKSQLLSLLTSFDKSADMLFQRLKAEIDSLLQGTSGAAFPIGNYDVKAAGGNITRLSVEAEAGKALLKFSYDKHWTIANVQPPEVAASADSACHLGLRKDLLKLTADVEQHAASELNWKRGKVPVKVFAHMNQEAIKAQDLRVRDITATAPFNGDASAWKNWAIAAQVYLLGSDFSARETFAKVLERVASEISEEG